MTTKEIKQEFKEFIQEQKEYIEANLDCLPQDFERDFSDEYDDILKQSQEAKNLLDEVLEFIDKT